MKHLIPLLALAACGLDSRAAPEPVTPADAGPLPVTNEDAGAVDASVPDAGAVSAAKVSYARDVQPIWNDHCIGCHSSPDFDLRAPGSFSHLRAALVDCAGAPRAAVVPGDAPASGLWHKLANVDLTCNREMPATGMGGLIAIDRPAFDRVERWISEGAADN